MTESKQYVVIMAGGSGTRMGTNLPKQLLPVGNIPMIVHLLKHADQMGKDVLLIVSEKNKNVVLRHLVDGGYLSVLHEMQTYRFMNICITVCIQPVANGTGGALMATKQIFADKNPNDQVLILSADVPLISKKTITRVLDLLCANPTTQCVVLGKETDDNFGYGRIVMRDNHFVKIVEQKDCTEQEKCITSINTGIYAFKIGGLMRSLDKLNCNNAQNEYYLTDCPKIITNLYDNHPVCVQMTDCVQYDETMGANQPHQLELLRKEYMKKFTIQPIDHTMVDLRDLDQLLSVLGQLSDVGKPDRNELMDLIRRSNSQIDQINKKYILVLRYEDQIVGTGSLLVEQKLTHNMGKVGHIEDVVVDLQYRGLGLARQMIELLICMAQDNNCYKVILDCSDDLIGFYGKMGFEKSANTMRLLV
jgi:dTDP-glucose pyrophosphorylase/GNAT superfamily N-acetyltransferase